MLLIRIYVDFGILLIYTEKVFARLLFLSNEFLIKRLR